MVILSCDEGPPVRERVGVPDAHAVPSRGVSMHHRAGAPRSHTARMLLLRHARGATQVAPRQSRAPRVTASWRNGSGRASRYCSRPSAAHPRRRRSCSPCRTRRTSRAFARMRPRSGSFTSSPAQHVEGAGRSRLSAATRIPPPLSRVRSRSCRSVCRGRSGRHTPCRPCRGNCRRSCRCCRSSRRRASRCSYRGTSHSPPCCPRARRRWR
jgi:hypothetical protein